jgi:ABC-2 type transport system ATP-binding protein
MIRIDSLVKTFDGLRAVDGLSLHVEAGQILGLVGPNGAGKTTALRCLAGIIPPAAGVITIGGFDLEKDRVSSRRLLAFVPDEPRLFDYLTAWDHLLVVARLYGVADGEARASQLLTKFGLEDRRLAFPAELSRGMKQKLMVALALLHGPQALILDEPLTGLDPAAMRGMKRTIGHRVLILQKGRTIMEGTLDEIRAHLPELDADADLEEIFMRATGAGAEGGGEDRSP